MGAGSGTGGLGAVGGGDRKRATEELVCIEASPRDTDNRAVKARGGVRSGVEGDTEAEHGRQVMPSTIKLDEVRVREWG